MSDSKDLVAMARDSIAAIDFENATPDQIRAAVSFVESLRTTTKALQEELDKAMMAWINFHGDLTIGEVRYYVGTEKHTKCPNKVAALTALFDACNGDFEGFAQCLASDAFKTGACKVVLGEDGFKRNFEVVVMPDLKTGKPKRSVRKVSLAFSHKMESRHAEE